MTDQLPAVPGDDDGQAEPVVYDTSYEAELDAPPVPGAALEPVDPPEDRRGELLPVRPDWLATREGFRSGAARAGGRAWHRAKYHGLRSPVYAVAGLFWAVIGGVRLVVRWLAWWLVPVPPAVHLDAAQDSWRSWKSVHHEHVKTTSTRAKISLAVGLPAALVAYVLARFAPWPVWPVLAAAAVLVLARAGHPAGKPIVTSATVTPRFRVLRADIVLRAYYAAKLGDPEKDGQQITFGSPMRRDGEGSRVLVDLPYGKGLDDAIAAKPAIASGLDVQVSQVFLHRDPTSHRRHVLWVADRDPLAVPVGRTPLLACQPADIWKAAPMGLDERGALVELALMWNSVLVGALPRSGKTFAARLLALFCALDPFVTLDVFDAKGSPDWRKFALVADSCAFGLTPTRDGLPPEILRATLQRIRADVEDRYHRLSAMDPKVCPEGKLTRKIARSPGYKMPVRVLVLDEFQEYYDLGKISKEIAALFAYLVKVAPGAGVIIIASTQRPSGIGGGGELGQLFTQFRDNFAVRFSLRTSEWRVSEMVLGAGALGEGLDSSKLLPQYKGVGILRGASDVSPTVRTHLADGKDAERILLAARALREAAGTLSGMAAGLDVEAPSQDVLSDVLAVFASDSGLQWQILASRLSARFPDRWAGASGESVSAQMRALGVPSVDVKAFGQVRKGCRRTDIEAATR
jgi:hypothetical protein